jgi:UTP--glucose-1-phosphate uridylyltransferase
MHIKHSVIAAAGHDGQSLPVQRLVDRDGVAKTALQIIVEEAEAAVPDDVSLVARPGDQAAFRAAAGNTTSRLDLIP